MKNTSNLVYGLLYFLIGIQLVSLWWVIIQFAYWADEDLYTYLCVAPLLILWVLIPYLLKLGQKPNIVKGIQKFGLPLGLMIQAILSWLLYAQLNRFDFFSVNSSNSVISGWVKTETMPIVWVIAWAFLTFLFVLPCIICLLVGLNPSAVKNPKSIHLGGLLMGIVLALRWGSALSGPMLLFYCDLILVPVFMVLFTHKDESTDKLSLAEIGIPSLPVLAIMFMMGFWWFIIEIQLAGILNVTYLWFVPATGHLLMLLINFKLDTAESQKKYLLFFMITWILLEIAAIFISIINLTLNLFQLRYVWLIIGTLISAIIPEVMVILRNEKAPKTPLIIWFSTLAFGLGLIVPYVINMEDPLSSYLTFVFWGLNCLMTIPFFIKKMHQK